MLLITILETCKALGKSHCNLHPKHNYRQQLKGKSESPKQIMNVCMLRVWGFTLGLGVGLCRWWRLWCGLFSSVKKNASLAALLLPALPLARSPRVTIQLDSVYLVLQTAFWPGNKVFKSLQMVPSKHVEQCFILRTVFVPSGIQVRRVCVPICMAHFMSFRRLWTVDSWSLSPSRKGSLVLHSPLPPSLTHQSWEWFLQTLFSNSVSRSPPLCDIMGT